MTCIAMHLPAQDLPVQEVLDWLSAQDNGVSIDASQH